jgi:hypothetical protein
MWSHTTIYIYRLRPRIIRQLKEPNLPNYIDCVSENVSMDYMINRHGGGRYLMEVTDSQKKKDAAGLFRCFFDVDEIRYEPKLNYEELDINHKENLSYVQMLQHRGILDNSGRVVNKDQALPNLAGANAEIVKELLTFFAKLNAEQQAALRSKLGGDDGDSLSKSLGQIFLERMKQDDPARQFSQMQAMLESVKTMVAKPPETSNAFDKLVQIQSDYNKTILQLFERLSQNNAPAKQSQDEVERLDKYLGFAEKLANLTGRNSRGAGERNGWDIGLDYAKELVVPGLRTLDNFLNMRRGMPPAPAVPAGAQPAAAAGFDPYKDQAAMRAHSAAVAQQIPQNPMNPAGDLMTLIQGYSMIVINALNNGTPGYDFADYVVGLFGVSTHAMIASQGESALLGAMLSNPQVAVFGEERIRTFVHEFVHYQEFLASDESESQEETVGV